MAAQTLEGKTALVTGSSRNLGAVIAERLAERGATVVLNYNTSAGPARERAKGLSEATGRRHVALPGDMSKPGDVRTLVETAQEELGGRIDVLVNNAGPFTMTPFSELPEEEWNRIWDANVKAAYLSSQIAAPAMRAAGWGRIVNISGGSIYVRNHSVYGLAKDGIVFLTEELACELGPEITVNAVAPGQIVESAADIEEFDPGFVPRAIEATPAKRLVTRSEVAEMIALLCTPAFDMVTGATIPLDGGWRFYRF